MARDARFDSYITVDCIQAPWLREDDWRMEREVIFCLENDPKIEDGKVVICRMCLDRVAVMAKYGRMDSIERIIEKMREVSGYYDAAR